MAAKRLLTRLPHASAPSPTLVRSFSSTQCVLRAPSLSDIVPGKIAEFDARQQRFREELAEKTRKQREAERASSHSAFKSSKAAAESSSPVTPSSTDAVPSDYTTDHTNYGLGSLSTARTGDAAKKADESANGARKPGRFSSLIYGTEEGREMDRDIERSFSQVLARGKYVHSIVFHEVKPDRVDDYVDLVSGWYPKVAANPENKVHLVGSWRTDVGDCDTFGEFCGVSIAGGVEAVANLRARSPYLGVPTLRGLPCIFERNSAPSRIRRL